MNKQALPIKLAAILLAGCAGPLAEAVAPTRETPERTLPPATLEAEQVKAQPTAYPTSPPTVTLLPCAVEGGLLLEVYQATGRVIMVDPCTGNEIPGHEPLALQNSSSIALWPDTSHLVVTTTENATGRDSQLVLFNQATWQQTPIDYVFDSWPRIVVGPNGMLAAFLYYSQALGRATLETVDLAAQRPLARYDFERDQNPIEIWFDADGGALIVYVQDSRTGTLAQPSHILRLDPASLKPLQDVVLEGLVDGFVEDASIDLPTFEPPLPGELYYTPGLAFDAARGLVYIVHADADRLTHIDVNSGLMETLAIAPQQTWLERLIGALGPQVAQAKVMNGTSKQAILAPDGTRLYALGVTNQTVQDDQGEWQLIQEFSGLQVIDPDTGVELAVIPTETQSMRLSADGRYLLLWGWSDHSPYFPWTEVFDLAKGRIVATIDDYQIADSVIVGGKRLLIGVRANQPFSRFLILDGDSFAPLARWEVDGYATFITPAWEKK